jgi:glycerophosphoryl diester phosphodiesterase
MTAPSQYLAPAFLPIAHRGGSLHPANIGHENTIEAFQVAVDLGYRYLETDVHATRDGVLVAFHDDRLDRVTDGAGRISDHTFAALSHIKVAGKYSIPRLEELFEAFGAAYFNIDIKQPGGEEPLAAAIKRCRAQSRVLVTSFSLRRLRRFRRLIGAEVPLGAGTLVVTSQLALFRLGIERRVSDSVALQVPLRSGPLRVVDEQFVAAAHRAGLKVHVWTIDEADEMNQLIDLGVDGIISDRIDVLKQVCLSRGIWLRA